jgi:hypothetical protein
VGKEWQRKAQASFLERFPAGYTRNCTFANEKENHNPASTAAYRRIQGRARDNVYVDILKIFRHEGRTWESTPKTYFVHPAEELRDMLLAHLNGHYEGVATGETFRMSGKTDIRIEDNSRAAFITECKIWEGSGNTFLCDQQPPSLIGQLLHEN